MKVPLVEPRSRTITVSSPASISQWCGNHGLVKEISAVIPGRKALGNSYTKVLVGVVSAQRLLQHQQAGAKALPGRPI